jgi:hypothetical protein
MYCVFLGKAVQTVNPGAGSVGTSQLATDAVTQAKMADDSVGTAEILDTNVTGAKLNDDAISGQGALGATPADTDEFLVSDAGVLKRVDYSYLKGGTPAVMVKAPNETSISNDTQTKVTLDTEIIDSGGTFTSDRWTPATAGTYFIFAQLYTATGGAENTAGTITIYKNGSAGNAVGSRLYPNNGTGGANFLYNTCMIDTADADDYYELYAMINCSGGSTINVSGYGKTFLGGFKIY